MKTNTADKWFSIYIRLRDSDENGLVMCCTCGITRSWKHVDCGHFIKRQHMSARFSEINCNAQCKGCNCFEQGNDAKFANFIIEKYGQDKFDLLMASKRTNHKYSQFEIDYLAKEYKEKATKLAKEKGIKL